ncbi:MAG: hypothetical protein EA387_10625 [Nitriliruptor sp.]|nr:MAG: hypothetical protein EA387_10625 [Nitriliruptor sp.]
MDGQERDLIALHAGFALVAAVVLLAPGQLAQGWRLWILLVGYDVATLVIVLVRGHDRWLRAWWFAAVTSVFQVVPDAFLAEGLGTLSFPADGAPDLGPVTASMALMWTVPLVLIASAADSAARRRGAVAGWVAAVVTAGLVFVGAEALLPPLGIWEPVGVTTIGGWLAPYVLPPELLLGAAAWWGVQVTRERHPLLVVPVAALVSLLYTGALAASWLLLERGLLA